MQEVKTYKDVSVVTPPCYDTLPTAVHVATAENPGMVIGFHQVPEGETAIRAAVFETRACGELTLHVTAGPNAPFEIHLPADGVLHVPQRPQIRQLGRIWFRFTAGTAGVPVLASDVTIHCDETGEDFVFHLEADVIPRPKVAVLMTLDQSESMEELAGIDTTTKRIDILHSAATSFIQLRAGPNGVGIVELRQCRTPPFRRDAVHRRSVRPGSGAATTAVQATQPGGSTSSGLVCSLRATRLSPLPVTTIRPSSSSRTGSRTPNLGLATSRSTTAPSRSA